MLKKHMADFIYSAWFVDRAADVDDQDREWIACIGIAAGSAVEAKQWGDLLAIERRDRYPDDLFLRSSIEEEGENFSGAAVLPRIKAGDRASDETIGW